MGFDFDVNYKGASRGDDNDLYARYAFPTENGTGRMRLSSDQSGHFDGGVYACLAREPEWEGRWWLEISLYEEIDGEFIGLERWNIDCIGYWITIDEQAHMQLHEGTPPWLRDEPQIPSFGALTSLAALGIALGFLRRR